MSDIRKKGSPLGAVVAAVIFIAVGVLYIVSGISKSNENDSYTAECTAAASARVISTESRKVKIRNGRYRREYRAVLDIEGYEDTYYSQWTLKKYSENEVVEVRYDPSDRADLYVPAHPPVSFKTSRGSIVAGVVMIVTGAGIVLILLAFTVRPKQRR